MQNLLVPNTGIITFKEHSDPVRPDIMGHLTAITGNADIPFGIKRVYYIWDVAGDQRRGFHSHRELHQVLIALGGTIKILVRTPDTEQVVELNHPAQGLYIGPYVWREMYDFSRHSTLLVLASEEYTESDYIRSYADYVIEARQHFERG